MNIELIRSDRRSLSIEVTSDMRVIVRAPKRLSVKEINRFIGEKADWIDRSLKKMEARKKASTDAGGDNAGDGKGMDVGSLSKQEVSLLMDKARSVIPAKVHRYAAQMGVTYGRITIRMQKSRWGSCSAKGNLNFNCLLMKMPDEIIDYVVVHELCHRKEMNHSPRFWAEVEKVIPDYKDKRKRLKEISLS
ncbi:MAG: M48 family metallopeptidase [Butyrivibrio sp.]|nr:M48 family metallopeptidase [Butyrivibrio sp.]